MSVDASSTGEAYDGDWDAKDREDEDSSPSNSSSMSWGASDTMHAWEGPPSVSRAPMFVSTKLIV